MKTLKEAYESVGETLQVGDCLGEHIKIRWVDGWFFDDNPYSKNYCTVFDSSRFFIGEISLPIRRNGKQIYPKVEKASAMQLKVDLLRYLEDNNTLMITETISDLIDAKIQEKRGGK